MKIIRCSNCKTFYKYDREKNLPHKCMSCGKPSSLSADNVLGKEDFKDVEKDQEYKTSGEEV